MLPCRRVFIDESAWGIRSSCRATAHSQTRLSGEFGGFGTKNALPRLNPGSRNLQWDERRGCYIDNRRVTSLRATILELSDFGLSRGITQVPGVAADSRPEQRGIWTREYLSRSGPVSNGNMGTVDIAGEGNCPAFEFSDATGARVVCRLAWPRLCRVVGSRNRGTC